MSGRHWFQEKGAQPWPFAACGKNVMGGSLWTIDMGAVSCPACRALVLAAIEGLKAVAAQRREREQSGSC